MTARILLIPRRAGAHRAPLQLLIVNSLSAHHLFSVQADRDTKTACESFPSTRTSQTGFGVDLLSYHAGECRAMHQLSAWVAVAAMLLALVAAPFFHVHEQDDHGHAGSLVHAHLPDSESPAEYPGHTVEPEHSH